MSPKAVFVRERFVPVRNGAMGVRRTEGFRVEIEGPELPPGRFSTGDFYLHVPDAPGRGLHRIAGNGTDALELDAAGPRETLPVPGAPIEIHVRLQQPQVDPERCIGCGICEHECPVSGLRAIRVTAENESRSKGRSFLL